MPNILGFLINKFLFSCLPSYQHTNPNPSTTTTSSQQSPWAEDLPIDLWIKILESLTHAEDLIRIRCVCRWWRYSLVTKETNHHPSRGQIPWLMLSPSDEDAACRIYVPSCKVTQEISLPDTRRMKPCGSSYGWLIMITSTEDMFLLNPITQRRIPLPPAWMFRRTPTIDCKFRRAVRKVELSCDPYDDASECVALAIYLHGLDVAFARPGDRAWTVVEFNSRLLRPLQDVAFYEGKFHAVTFDGDVLMFDIRGSYGNTEELSVATTYDGFVSDRFLVESSGDLLQVAGYFNPVYRFYYHKTQCFKVSRFDEDCGDWVELKTLGNRSLFLGFNSSMSVSVSDLVDCRKNCIYFTDDKLCRPSLVGMRVVGVYSMDEETFKLYYMENSGHSPPIWFIPNPW